MPLGRNGRTGLKGDRDLRFGAEDVRLIDSLERNEYAGRDISIWSERTSDIEAVRAAAAGCMRYYLGLADRMKSSGRP